MNTAKLLKTSILSTIVFLSVSFGTLSSYANEASLEDVAPTIDIGSPILTVDNQTDFDLTFTVTFPSHLKSWAQSLDDSTYGYFAKYLPITEIVSVIAHQTRHCPKAPQLLKFISNDRAQHEYWFGVPGQVSETLTITSPLTRRINGTSCIPNEAWPNNEAIVITLKKGKSQYNGVIDPRKDKDKERGNEWTPRITWKLEWKTNGWYITLQQTETDTGVIIED